MIHYSYKLQADICLWIRLSLSDEIVYVNGVTVEMSSKENS